MQFRKANRRPTDTGAAERILKQSVETLRENRSGESTPLSFLKTRVEAKAAQQESRKDSAMSRAMDIFSSRPKTSLTVIAAIAAFLFVTLIPFSYSKTVGYTVSFTEPDGQVSADPNQLVAAMSALGFDNVTANFNSNGTETVWDIKGLPDEYAARAAAAAFHTLSGTELEPTIAPVVKKVSGSLYAQVREQLFEVSISIDEASSVEEIEAQIQAQLIAQGFQPGKVQVIMNPGDSTVSIQLEIEQ